MPKTLCVDFDGVLHSYTSGWQGIGLVSDPPVPGAMQFLVDAVEKFDEVCVYSSRSVNQKGVWPMQDALVRWLVADLGYSVAEAQDFVNSRLKFPTQKPAAYVTLDDRCVCFDGTFPAVDSLVNFTPWNKK